MKTLKVLCAVMTALLTFVHATAQETAKSHEDIDLPIKEIVKRYYAGKEFYVGAAPSAVFLEPNAVSKKKLDLFISEFSYITPANAFKQASVYTHPGAAWKADEYRQWIDIARKNNMVLRCHGPVSPQCSQWAKGTKEEIRSGEELLPVMEHYMTELSKDLEKNKDVVQWMDVVNETVVASKTLGPYKQGDWFGPIAGASWQNPWLQIGLDNSTDVPVPLYIIRAFELANQHAPSIKKLYNHNSHLQQPAWDKIKATVKFLRARGLAVDAVGWQAHIPLGWEKDPQNMKDFEDLIDWCYQNNLEFHITELNVVRDKRLSEKTIPEVADTYYALTSMMTKKVGRGAVGLGFWDVVSTDIKEASTANRAGLFDIHLSRQSPQYLAVKRALLDHAPK